MIETSHLIHQERVNSTQDLAKSYIAQNSKTLKDEDIIVFQADQQDSGRGRHGHVWTSPFGNLYMSILIRPNVSQKLWGQISFVCAVALWKALSNFVGTDQKLNLKWPNDILLNTQKLSGILLETHQNPSQEDSYLIIGMGVNVQSPPEGAACLKTDNVAKVRDVVIQNFIQTYNQWAKDGFTDIRQQWINHAIGIGNQITVRTAHTETKGIFSGIDHDGALILDGQHKIHAGQVFFD